MRLRILIGIAVVLAVVAVWRLGFSGRSDGPVEKRPDLAKIEHARRRKNIDVLKRAIKSSNPEIAGRAAAAMADIGPQALPVIEKALEDQRPRVREKAATAFAKVAPREQAGKLAEMVKQDRSANVRAAAVTGLERMFAYDQMETIIAAMEDPDVAVRRRAAAAARRFAGIRVGYRADDPPAKRHAAVQRMREIWQKEAPAARRYWEAILKKRQASGRLPSKWQQPSLPKQPSR
ncbi:MAG: HEAT repeat domain-containing protein [Planctomycetes bacterium]|nr:HEAT repeat domain-containing protein [Planctomycetota bacterium]